MTKIPFKISAVAEGDTAVIRITGEIGWDVDAESFRRQIDALIAEQKTTNAHLYLFGPGGSVFDAEEICNIISTSFPKGKVTGEGGSLVASAYTRIAMMCESFKMPENGTFMVHKPSAGAYGDSAKLESMLKLLKDKETQYLTLYKTKAKDVQALEEHWNKGDWWMTAQEAKDMGFVTEVVGNESISTETRAMIAACGCPDKMIPKQTNNIETKMDLKSTAKALGLSETATEAEITAAIEKGQKAQKELDDLKAETTRKEKVAKAKIIKEEVLAAAQDKRITADKVQDWVDALTENYERNSKLLGSLSPVTKVTVTPGKSPTGKITHNGKTFEELQEEDSDALGELLDSDPEAYESLYDNYLKRNKLKK